MDKLEIIKGIIFCAGGGLLFYTAFTMQDLTTGMLVASLGWLCAVVGGASLGQQLGFYKMSKRR